MFDALVSDSEETSTIEIRKKNKKTGKFDKIPTEMLNQEVVAKECEAIKAKQDKIVKEAMTKVNIIYNKDVIIGLLEEDVPSSITGLVAMKVADNNRKPVMIGKEYGDTLAGSLRASDGLDFKRILTISRLFNFVSGHASAAGWDINNSQLEDLYEYLDEYEFNGSSEYLVDKLYNKPEESDIYSVEINKHVFGGEVNWALFGYKNIKFNKKCISTRGSVTTFFDNGVSFVLFNSPSNIQDEIENNLDERGNVTMDLVGEPRVQKFGNKETPQIIIKDYEFLDNYDIIEEEPANKFGIDF